VDELSVVTVFFNPAGYSSLLQNYFIFAESLKKNNINLITIECAFNDGSFYIPEEENVYRLRSDSIMWQKERLINYGVSKLPESCKYFAWIDCDVLFLQDNWAEQACEKLKTCDIIQLFKKIFYMPKGMLKYDGTKIPFVQSVIWQYKIHKNWLNRRRANELPFSAPGFAWACRKDFFSDLGGIYDKNIVGSGDTFLVDCLLDSWDIHGFASKFNEKMKIDLMEYCGKLKNKNPVIDYIPVEITHLWHGNLKNRKYMDRHDVIKKYDYDPKSDIVLRNDVYEWSTEKPQMHEDIRQYFFERKEDSEI